MKTKESHGKFIRMIDTTIASLELEVLLIKGEGATGVGSQSVANASDEVYL
jgi:hypothetical protein